MTAFEDLRDETLAVYTSLTGVLAPRLAPTRTRLLAESRDKLAAGQLVVVVCGEFKRGKSSLLNALVERPGLFPVDADIATSAVMTLRSGPRDAATVYFAETVAGKPDSAPPPQDIKVSQAAEFVTEQGNPRNAKNVLRIEMAAPMEHLASGMMLVDTPGIGSLNPAHTAATRAYLKYADAILFVVSVSEPVGTLELVFLRLALKECPTVVTAVTMIDRVVDPAPIVAETRARIAREAGRDPASLVVVPVSAHRKRDALDDGDAVLLTESGFPQLEAELWQGLTVTVGAAQVNAALRAMYQALAEAAAPVANDLAALRGDPGKTDVELREQYERVRQLKTDAVGWKRGLSDDLDVAVRPVLRRLESDMDQLFEAFRAALGMEEAVEDPDRLIRRASSAMVAAADQANDALEGVFAELTAKYTALTDLPIVVSGVAVQGAALAVSVQAPAKAPRPKTGFTTARQIWTGGVFAASLGSVIGTVAFPGVGTVVGAAVGLVAGLFGAGRDYKKTSRERERKEYVAELRAVVLEKLSSGRKLLIRDIGDQINDYSRALTRKLHDEITAKGDSLTASIRALEESARRDAQSRADRARDLGRQQAELAALRAQLDRLGAQANALASQPATASGGPA
ncbi:MAG: dynamin family protein [Streptosporangiaceae bacterium]